MARIGSRVGTVVVVGLVLAVTALPSAVASAGGVPISSSPRVAPQQGPTSPPPPGAKVLEAGQIPTWCTEADYAEGASNSRSNLGVYWSDVSERWESAPWCYPRWGLMAMSPSLVISPGGTATMTLIWDDARMAGYIQAGFGGVTWDRPAGATVVAGCGEHDVSCTVSLGSALDTDGVWHWFEFHANAPGRVFILPPSYPTCQPDNPCLDTPTNAWGWVGLRPADAAPHADFTFSVDGGRVDLHATSTDPNGSALTHRWDFGDGTSGTGSDPSHTYTRAGTFTVGLTSTNGAGLSDTTTRAVTVAGQPLEITSFSLDDPNPDLTTDHITLTVEITNNDTDPVTDVVPAFTTSDAGVLELLPGADTGPFDLAGGATRQVQATYAPRRTGEAQVGISVDGAQASVRTAPVAAHLPVEVGSGVSVSLRAVDVRRQGADGTATIEATIHNGSGSSISELIPLLFAKPVFGVSVSDPTGVPATLADGADAVLTYQLDITTADAIELTFVTRAIRDVDGVALDSPPAHLELDRAGATIDSVFTDRTGVALADPGGGEPVHVLGHGFLDTVDVEIRDRSGQAPIHPSFTVVSDTEVVLDPPEVTGRLQTAADGARRWESSVVLLGRATAPGGPLVESNPAALTFEGPVIESIAVADGSAGADAFGGEVVTVHGRNMALVASVVLPGAGSTEARAGSDVEAVSDQVLTFRSPDMTDLLRRLPSGAMVHEALVRLDEAVPSADTTVSSNLAPLSFEGPMIESIDLDAGPAAGGTHIAVEGRHLGHVDRAQFYAAGGTRLADGASVIHHDDHLIEIVTPDVSGQLIAEDLEDGRLRLHTALVLGSSTGLAAPNGVLSSNATDFRFDGPVATQTTVGASAGSTEVAVTSTQGWAPGDYAQLGTHGPIRRVGAIGSLIFDAPIPADLAPGTLITKVDPPLGDRNGPHIEARLGTTGAVTVPLGGHLVPEYACTEPPGEVGVEACVGPAPSGTAVDTASPGVHHIDLVAWDRNGNVTRARLSYTVEAQASGGSPEGTGQGSSPGGLPSDGGGPGGGSGGASGGAPASVPIGSTVGVDPGSSPLARTGWSGRSAPIGALLLVAGTCLYVLGRRRRPASRTAS